LADDDIADDESGGPEAQTEHPSADDHLFGIDLGPKYARDHPDPVETPEPERVKQPTRTLTERLAAAATDRDDDETPTDEKGPAQE